MYAMLRDAKGHFIILDITLLVITFILRIILSFVGSILPTCAGIMLPTTKQSGKCIDDFPMHFSFRG
jgi:hypothetical protein